MDLALLFIGCVASRTGRDHLELHSFYDSSYWLLYLERDIEVFGDIQHDALLPRSHADCHVLDQLHDLEDSLWARDLKLSVHIRHLGKHSVGSVLRSE